MMKPLFHQHPFYQLTVTLCLFITLSNCAQEIAEDFPLYKNGELITACEEMNTEDMLKHVYVYGDSPDGIQLKCPVEEKEFLWDEKPQTNGQYEPVYHYRKKSINNYTTSGDSLETYALDIGKPSKGTSGIYCCKKSDGSEMLPFLSHAVFVFSKTPVINLTVSKSNPKKGDEISLKCLEPPKSLPDGYPKPLLFWEKNSVEMNELRPEFQFTATIEDHGSSFRCGWKYDKLANNGGLRTFYSNFFSLEVEFLVIDEQLSTNNSGRIDVLPGNSTTLTCVVKAYPPRTGWRWTKVPLTTTIEEDIDHTLEGKFIISTTQGNLTIFLSLTVNHFSKEDVALYSCQLGENTLRDFDVQDERYSPQQPTIGPWKITSSSNDQFLSVGLILISLLTTALLT